MITIDNILVEYPKIDQSILPQPLKQEEFEFVRENYDLIEDDDIKQFIYTFIDKLNQLLNKETEEKDSPAEEKNKTGKKRSSKVQGKKKTTEKQPHKDGKTIIDLETQEMVFIKRFAGWQDKVKTKKQIYNFIRQIQNAIIQKKVRKNSEFALLIMEIQHFLVKMFDNLHSGSKTVSIPEKLYSSCKERVNYKWADHVIVIKKYINILSETKTALKDKAQILLKKIENNSFNPQIQEVIDDIKSSLKNYLKGETDRPQLQIYTLQGLMGLAGISGLGNIENPAIRTVNNNDPTIHSSMQIKDKKFDLLNLNGKWKNLLGYVSTPFKLMFWGGGGSGKTTLALEFAGYLAKELNKKCLFIPNEERVTSYTFVDKLNRTKASSLNLDAADTIPTSLYGYDIIFLDSITTMNIGLEAMIKLTEQYPKISWVWLFQTTKEGMFRGDQNWQHFVDAEIYCSNGKAKALKNRFGGKGAIEIY